MSDTPRTDVEETVCREDEMCVPISFARQLERELAAAIKQRDEARREVCRYWSNRSVDVLGVHRSALDFATDRGWDCFAKERGGA